MAADGKWVEGLTADTKWADAAERILAARLDAVENNWHAALEEKVDPEPVHQLRVATRRARAAVQIFADVLPKRVVRELGQSLKKLRKVAGSARDWDVFNIHRHEWAAQRPPEEQPGLDFLSGMALALRELAQSDLTKSERYQVAWEKLRLKVKPQRGKRWRLGNRVPRLIETMLAEFQQTTEGDLTNAERLHQVRIAGKRLRYALELFIDVLDTNVRERILPLMEEVQDILGNANDANNLKKHIDIVRPFLPTLGTESAERYSIGINAWCEQLTQDAAIGYPQFQKWLLRWRGEHDI